MLWTRLNDDFSFGFLNLSFSASFEPNSTKSLIAPLVCAISKISLHVKGEIGALIINMDKDGHVILQHDLGVFDGISQGKLILLLDVRLF